MDLFPVANDLEIGDFFEAFEHGLFFGVVNFLAAGVIGAALHVTSAQRAEVLFKEGNVLEEELLLKILGAGGDDHALAGKNRGDQIGQRLAGAGASLDDQVLFIGERGLDGFGHFELAVAIFVVGMPFGQQSPLAEELTDCERFSRHRKRRF